MLRPQLAVGAMATFLLCLMAALDVSGVAAYKALSQTIPEALSIYLPIVMKQELPTPTATLIPAATATPTLTSTPTPMPTSRPNCHASYPSVCIPPPPPDLDCPNISYRRFKVLPPDPHNFDADHDGVGCEN